MKLDFDLVLNFKKGKGRHGEDVDDNLMMEFL